MLLVYNEPMNDEILYRRAVVDDLEQILQLNDEFLKYTIDNFDSGVESKTDVKKVGEEIKRRVNDSDDGTPLFVVCE